MDSDNIVEIEQVKGGYEVSVRDPALVKSNSDPKKPYKNPVVEYNFPDVESVVAFLQEVLPKLSTEDASTTFDAAWERATSNEEKDDG